MGSDGMQITIPDFHDDDDFRPSLFGGRSQQASLWSSTGSGLDSPTLLTPQATSERPSGSYFHSRGDSIASQDSGQSVTYSARKVKAPFTHSTQSSVATNSSSPFAKKSSFASLRNAFKSNKFTDPPPMPALDHQAYPVLKNPFNRSTSSLAQHAPMPQRSQTMNASPPHFRPSTPASVDSRSRTQKLKDHQYAKSQHSHSGSFFHNSDNGSDQGHAFSNPFSSSPPPVPPMPTSFGGQPDERTSSDIEDSIVLDPRTPSDYALHAIFIRFAASAESHIDEFLRFPVDRDVYLEDYMGPGVDEKFDDILASLGKVAQRHAKAVVNSVMRWRKSQTDPSPQLLQFHLSQSPSSSRAIKMPDIPQTLKERKFLASVYTMCRALIAVTRSVSKDGLPEPVGHELEELTFEEFKHHDSKLSLQSANYRCIAELHAALLGHLADIRFESVTDRFLAELKPIAAGQVGKDMDVKYENLVKGVGHISIKVWPPERFEEGAEFLASLSKVYENAHGNRLKTIFAETMVRILHPIGKTAQAEVNHPDWAKAIELIYPKARDMMVKPRYWHVAYPLAVTALCVAPTEYFLRNWTACFEAGLGKLKERIYRVPVLNGMLRLLWTYLYRCHESMSTVSTKLDMVFKHFFPPNRVISQQEEHLQPFVYIVHFVLSRHFDIGSELCLDFLQERAVASQGTSNLSPERLSIAVHATLLSLHLIEREEPLPAWPSNSDFTNIPSREDYPSSSEVLPATIASKAGWKDFLDRSSACLNVLAQTGYSVVGRWSVLDEQWSTTRLGPSYEDAHSHIIRHHPEGSVAYPEQFSPHINMLQVIYSSWPRLLHPSLALEDAFDMLIRGVIHIETGVGEAATLALQRFMADPAHASTLLTRFSTFLFGPAQIVQESNGLRLPVECTRLLNLWYSFVDRWAHDILQKPFQSWTDEETATVTARIEEIETGALFLLVHRKPSAYITGVKALRLLKLLMEHMQPEPITPASIGPSELFTFVHAFFDEGTLEALFRGLDEVLEGEALNSLSQWKLSTRTEKFARLAESKEAEDRVLWREVFPPFVQVCAGISPAIAANLREKLVAAASRGTQTMQQLSGVPSRLAYNAPQRAGSVGDREGSRLVVEHGEYIGQWHMWMKVICATASVPGSRSAMGGMRDHSRARSDSELGPEQMHSTHDLFWALSKFLDSEHATFREAAVSCISSFPANGYSQLLEDLTKLQARQHYDDPRTKGASASPMLGRMRRQERFLTALSRIFFLTAHLLQDQRFSGKQTALSFVLKYVRNMQTFLVSPENKDRWDLQRLRQYFCGTIERLFDALATLKDSDRFIPRTLYLTLYTMCEEWCQLGKQSEGVKRRLVDMQTSVAKSHIDRASQAEAIQTFQLETRALSHAAVGAMAAVCQKAFFPPEVDTYNSPTDRPTLDYVNPLNPLKVGSTLDRLTAILASYHEANQEAGKKALRSLLSHHKLAKDFLDECLRRAFVTSRELDTSNARFFEVVADAICSGAATAFSFAHVLCLGLSNLCHPLLEIRRQSFNILEFTHEQSAGIISLSQYEAAVCSSAPSTYLHAQRLISDVLAGEHPVQAVHVLAQFADWIPKVFDNRSERGVLLLLQTLEYWTPNIDLMHEDRTELSQEGRLAIYHLMTLTMRYAETYAEQILVLWTRLVDPPNQANGHAVIRFLLEQSHKVGSTIFISCAAKIVACLSQSVIGRQIVEELCSVVEPARMLPSIEHKLAPPSEDELQLWSDLDILFSEKPRLSLGVAQFALLFLSETALERYWEFQDQIPVLFHALFMHLDHRQPFVQQRSRHMLFQLLRACLTGYDELSERLPHRSRAELKDALQDLEKEAEARLWKEDDSSTAVEPKLQWFGSAVLALVEPLHPALSELWGTLALNWGTACSIRPVAFRSLQLYRALMPRIGSTHVGMLLGRLANTISDEDLAIQSFNVEIVSTLTALASSNDLDPTHLPQLFWTAVACLSTTVEAEFLHTLHLLDAVLDRVDLEDPEMTERLFAHMPTNWAGSISLQSHLLIGLRSSVTSGLTLKLLQKLTKINDPRLIDPSEGRVRDLYTLSLPWCLHAMSEDNKDESLQEFALNISQLAEAEERPSIERIMTSFAKTRFRTKDDFLRQSVASLREHYGIDNWTEVITLLMGLVLNSQRWLQVQTMQVLKVLFQQRETKNRVDLLGSELLMPLLRLLETDLASEALDVLDEPMQISGGPAAKHVLRMSLHHHLRANVKEVESVAEVFGIPQESGWCCPRTSLARDMCRANVVAVFDLGKGTLRPSRIDFQPDDSEELALSLGLGRGRVLGRGHDGSMLGDDDDDDLGDMVQNLHELSSFFQEQDESGVRAVASAAPTRQLEARVAAILAKSSGEGADVPQTPFVDVFNVGGLSPTYEDSEDSDSDSGSDLFEYDSPSFARFVNPSAAHNSH